MVGVLGAAVLDVEELLADRPGDVAVVDATSVVAAPALPAELADGRDDGRRAAGEDLGDLAASGEITEIFACGTAAVITPVGELRWEGGSCDHRRGVDYGDVTRAIREKLLDIQYGRAEDTHHWLTRLV
ncbi:hypothetical protein BJM39_02225 [Salmonella enterica subsp. enterica serovar Javiana]|nr:hypothetical protein BJM39_02225 [Salmonella enterica subsp. enterica serovar Javiana]